MENFQLFHVTCKGLIFYKNSFLLYRTSDPEAFGTLDCPGGRVDKNELIENTLKRELKEELNLDLDKTENNLELFLVNQTSETDYGWDEKTQIIEIYYRITIPDHINLELKTLEEVSDFEWIDKTTNLDNFTYRIANRKDIFKKAQQLL